MLFWIAIVVFAVPLYLFVRQARFQKTSRQKKLNRIQSRLLEKKMVEIEQKKQRISQKFDDEMK